MFARERKRHFCNSKKIEPDKTAKITKCDLLLHKNILPYAEVSVNLRKQFLDFESLLDFVLLEMGNVIGKKTNETSPLRQRIKPK